MRLLNTDCYKTIHVPWDPTAALTDKQWQSQLKRAIKPQKMSKGWKREAEGAKASKSDARGTNGLLSPSPIITRAMLGCLPYLHNAILTLLLPPSITSGVSPAPGFMPSSPPWLRPVFICPSTKDWFPAVSQPYVQQIGIFTEWWSTQSANDKQKTHIQKDGPSFLETSVFFSFLHFFTPFCFVLFFQDVCGKNGCQVKELNILCRDFNLKRNCFAVNLPPVFFLDLLWGG